MAAKLKFDSKDVNKLKKQLGAAQANLSDLRELWWDIQKHILIPSAAKTFDAEGRPVSWPSLNEAYAMRKANKVGHTRILVWSETLMESVTSESGTEYSVRDVGKRRMLFGTTVEYAGVHQYGSKDGTTPARPFLVMQQEDYEAMLNRTVDYILSTGDYVGSGASATSSGESE